MYQEQRIKAILKLLEKKEQLSTQEIMSKFNISRDTARRDIIEVVETGQAIRTHGGLISTKQNFPVLDFYERQKDLSIEKKEIAKLVNQQLKENGLYYFDVSTIMAEVSKKVGVSCQIYTHALDNAQFLAANAKVALNLLGGAFDFNNRFFYSELDETILSEIKFDIAFIGAASLENDGIYFKEKENAKLKRQVVKRARQVILVAENKKFFKSSSYRGAFYSEIDVLITDQPLTKAQLELFDQKTKIYY